jgi:AmmeMemoRadiSam system protein A
MQLTEEEKQILLQRARLSIESALARKPLKKAERLSEVLEKPAGAFVTLRLRGELRGCIGYIEPRLPLIQTVEEVATKAALEDPRFLPLSTDELRDTDIEVSVLSPLQKVESVDEIEVGKHGLVIDAGFTRGLLLPQVAEEYHWSRDEFLRHTAIKAGLPPDAWNHPAVELYCFTVEKFSESEFAIKHH